MSKERLEEVIELMCERYHDYLVTDNLKRAEDRYKSYLDYKEIIKSEFEKQAERVQELEELEQEYVDLNSDFTKLALENKRYRKALEFYANRDNYKLEHFDPNLDDYMSTVDYDEGQKARKALKEGEE